jgi:radical SAM protein with 4Fe4S-binding SPASM domain
MQELPGLGDVDPRTYKTEDLAYPRIDREQLAQALARSEVAAREVGIDLRLPRMPRERLLDYHEGHLDLTEFECRNAWNTLFIGRQGNAYPCWIRNVGNVRDHSIKELWNNATMRGFRQACQKQVFATCPGCCFLEHKTDRTCAAQSNGNGSHANQNGNGHA